MTLMLQEDVSVLNAKFPHLKLVSLLLLSSLKVYFICCIRTTPPETWVPQPLSSAQPHFWQPSVVVHLESCCSQKEKGSY